MKTIEFIKKYQIILFLSFFVVVLIVLKLIYNNGNKNQVDDKVLIPTPTLSRLTPTKGISYEVLNDGNPDYPLKKLLPYSTDKFKIIGYDDPFILVVRIKSGTNIEVEKEIREWIEKNIPGDKEHKIIFTD